MGRSRRQHGAQRVAVRIAVWNHNQGPVRAPVDETDRFLQLLISVPGSRPTCNTLPGNASKPHFL